jgi:signal transduction histidine kinase
MPLSIPSTVRMKPWHPRPASDEPDFRRELRSVTRTSGILAGAVALVLYPSWAFVDLLLEPAMATDFLRVRLVATLALIPPWLILLRHRWGRSAPEVWVFLLIVVLQLASGWMTVQASEIAAYLLGYVLPIFAAAALIVWSYRWTVATLALSAAILGAFALLRPDGILAQEILVTFAVLSGVGIIALVAAYHQDHLRRREFRSREALERERAEAAFLLDASRVLASSFDYETTLGSLARLTVPAIADGCILELREANGTFRPVGIAHVDAEKERLLRAVLPREGAQRHPLHAVFARGRSLLVADVSEEVKDRVVGDGETRRVVDLLAPRSAMVVPLAVGGRSVGVLTLVSAESGRRFGERDLALVESLARRAALAVDNARLYLRERTATRMRDEVLGVVAHDLRNPLNTIVLGADMLSEDGAQPTARIIRRAADRMNRLIQDLLDVQRLESGRGLGIEARAEAAEPVVREVAMMFSGPAAAQGVRLEIEVEPGVAATMDGGRIIQVLANLVGNALKFTPQGGVVRIEARRAEGGIRFAVSDTGSGIPAEHIPHLFSRYWQADPDDRRGVGLGLPIAAGIVEAHGGTIGVQSEVGAGTTISFTIPAAEPLVRERPAKASTLETPAASPVVRPGPATEPGRSPAPPPSPAPA